MMNTLLNPITLGQLKYSIGAVFFTAVAATAMSADTQSLPSETLECETKKIMSAHLDFTMQIYQLENKESVTKRYQEMTDKVLELKDNPLFQHFALKDQSFTYSNYGGYGMSYHIEFDENYSAIDALVSSIAPGSMTIMHYSWPNCG